MATHICLQIVCGYLPPTMTEWSHPDRDHMAHQVENIYCLTFIEKVC
jgi:hypothetical protein